MLALRLHPDSRCAAVTHMEADVARPRPGALALVYVVTGEMRDLFWPPAAAPARADELWRRTCFEAFVGASPGKAYLEFNFSPARQWAAYSFSGYRAGMRVASGVAAPRIEVRTTDQQCELRAWLELEPTSLPGDAAWRVGLSAVIEETSGRKSYWALAHPPGKADFHHVDGFAYEVAAAEAT